MTYTMVMVRRYHKIIAIPFFDINNKVIGYIPYIIDCGFSRINIGGIGFGKIGYESIGIESDKPFPMYDVYKILGFLGENFYTDKHINKPYAYEISLLLETLFSFFNEGSLIERVQKRLYTGRDYYNRNNNLRSVTHDDYINWIRHQSGIINPIHTNIATLIAQGIYTAPIKTSIDTCKFYDMVSSEKGPNSSLEFCEIVEAINNDTALDSHSKQEALSWLNEHFNAEEYFQNALPTILRILETNISLQETYKINDNNMIPDISLSSSPDLDSLEFINMYKTHIINLLTIKDVTADVATFIKASICSLAIQGKFQKYRDKLEEVEKTTIAWIQYIDSQKKILQKNLAYAKSISWDSRTSDKKILSFWKIEHKNLILAL